VEGIQTANWNHIFQLEQEWKKGKGWA
jgi:hypothetical protein